MILAKLTDVPASEDVAEAIAAMWKKAGVETPLVQMDVAERDRKQRQLELNKAAMVWSTASHQLTGVRVYNTALHGLRGQAIELPEINELYRRASSTLNDDAKVEPIWRELGDKAFASFQSVPLFWLDTKLAVNPAIVADYVYPASISGSWTHLENIKAAR